MIAYLNGTVLRKGGNWLIVGVENLGFKVFAAPGVVLSAKVGGPIALWTHEQVREDSREFFGFASPEELELFWKLITVSGVGPKVALALVGSSNAATVRKWVDEANVAALAEIRGVGQKTAQKIVLELKGKLTEAPGSDEAAEALIALGYSREEARGALAGVSGTSAEERVKAALRALGKR